WVHDGGVPVDVHHDGAAAGTQHAGDLVGGAGRGGQMLEDALGQDGVEVVRAERNPVGVTGMEPGGRTLLGGAAFGRGQQLRVGFDADGLAGGADHVGE